MRYRNNEEVIAVKCSKCGMEVPDDSSFCQYCGAEMPKVTRCAYCNAELSDDMKFCAMCGKNISFDNADAPSTPTPAKKGNGSRSISKGMFVAVSCVCAVAIICSCVLGYIAHYNHNSSESWKIEAKNLKDELAQAETDVAVNSNLQKQISQLQKEKSKLAAENKALKNEKAQVEAEYRESSEEINFYRTNIGLIIDGSDCYHSYDCPFFQSADSFWANTINGCEYLGYSKCLLCGHMN